MKQQNSIFWKTVTLGGSGLALVMMWGCSSLGGKSARHPISKGPYLQAAGSDTMSVMWESLQNYKGAVRYWSEGQPEQLAGAILPQRMVGVSPSKRTNLVTSVTNGVTVTKTNVTTVSRTNFYYVYRAALTNLQPGMRYTYSVELAGRRTEPRMFKTFNPEADSVRFIAYGDSRSNPKVHRAVAGRFLEHEPEFILHTGDLVLAGKDYGQWLKQFFEPVQGVADQVPFFAVPGNHEEDLKNYLAYFPMKGSNRWYSFDAGPVHVLAIDYHFEKDTHEQFKFAKKDLNESKAPWKVIFLHNPIFNFGGHSSAWGHQHYLSMFHEAKVDLVFGGHSHFYERFRPIAPTNPPSAWAVTAITTGGGGAELNRILPHPAQAAGISTNHFVAVEANRDRLVAKVIRVDGAEIDRFELYKPGGRQTPEFLAQVYPEEAMKVTYEIGPNLLAKLASVPTNRQPAMAMITLPPLKTSPQPAQLEITLAPDSAKNYSVKEFPLRVATPAKGETNKVVWVTVNYIGKRKVKGTPELSPELVLQARATGTFGETLAYGPASRTSVTAAGLAKKLTKTEPAPADTGQDSSKSKRQAALK
jgi:predicted phosphodiesterase